MKIAPCQQHGLIVETRNFLFALLKHFRDETKDFFEILKIPTYTNIIKIKDDIICSLFSTHPKPATNETYFLRCHIQKEHVLQVVDGVLNRLYSNRHIVDYDLELEY